MNTVIKIAYLTAVSAIMYSTCAQASAVVFAGQNPAVFPGANPANASVLLASTNRPRDPAAAAAAAAGQLDPASVVQQSVLGQISAKINDQIFNGGQAAGSYDLGSGNLINYVRAGGNLTIYVTDPVHGRTTITLPDL
jgi:hypothetical protein